MIDSAAGRRKNKERAVFSLFLSSVIRLSVYILSTLILDYV